MIAFASRKLVIERPDFGNVFRKIKDIIDSDVTRMKSIGRQVLRPVVFFMSECQPVDEEWRGDHASLVDRNNPYWPNIIAIGMGQADRPWFLKLQPTMVQDEQGRHICWRMVSLCKQYSRGYWTNFPPKTFLKFRLDLVPRTVCC